MLAALAASGHGCRQEILPLPNPGFGYELVPANFAVALARSSKATTTASFLLSFDAVNIGTSTVPVGAYNIDLYLDGSSVYRDHAVQFVLPGAGYRNQCTSAPIQIPPGRHAYEIMVRSLPPDGRPQNATNILCGTFDIPVQQPDRAVPSQ